MTLPRAMLFDMDGTLTCPLLDFPLIKREMGIGSLPILEALAEMTESRRAEAVAILARHELHAARDSSLNPGCRELLATLAGRGVATALITRNSAQSVRTVLERHDLPIAIVIAREDAPPKPSPRPLWLACEKLGVEPSAAWMIGDGQYDVEAGNAAGIRTVWVSHGKARPFTADAWLAVRDLCELRAAIEAIEASGL